MAGCNTCQNALQEIANTNLKEFFVTMPFRKDLSHSACNFCSWVRDIYRRYRFNGEEQCLATVKKRLRKAHSPRGPPWPYLELYSIRLLQAEIRVYALPSK